MGWVRNKKRAENNSKRQNKSRHVYCVARMREFLIVKSILQQWRWRRCKHSYANARFINEIYAMNCLFVCIRFCLLLLFTFIVCERVLLGLFVCFSFCVFVWYNIDILCTIRVSTMYYALEQYEREEGIVYCVWMTLQVFFLLTVCNYFTGHVVEFFCFVSIVCQPFMAYWCGNFFRNK